MQAGGCDVKTGKICLFYYYMCCIYTPGNYTPAAHSSIIMCQLSLKNLGCHKWLYTFCSQFFRGLGYIWGYTDMTSPCTLVHGRRVKKRTIIYSTPDFLEVVGACACIVTRPFLLPLPRRAWCSNMLILFWIHDSNFSHTAVIKYTCCQLSLSIDEH